jgi:hypothetical protein
VVCTGPQRVTSTAVDLISAFAALGASKLVVQTTGPASAETQLNKPAPKNIEIAPGNLNFMLF